jgi:hypothetical protein
MNMTDKRNFIEQTLSRSEMVTGKPMSEAELATEFARLGPVERVDHLMRIDGDLKGTDFPTPREAARFHTYYRRLKSAHQQLQAVQR